MSFQKSLTLELSKIGCEQTGPLSFALPSSQGGIAWQISFRILGFAKDQIDGALRYRHAEATPFGYRCLSAFAGKIWERTDPDKSHHLSSGFAVGPIAGWRADHTFDSKAIPREFYATQIAKDLSTKVIPFVGLHQTSDQLLKLLAADREPFPWYRSQGLTRLAEIAWLERAVGSSPPQLLALASTHQDQLQDQLDGVTLADYIKGIRSTALLGS